MEKPKSNELVGSTENTADSFFGWVGKPVAKKSGGSALLGNWTMEAEEGGECFMHDTGSPISSKAKVKTASARFRSKRY